MWQKPESGSYMDLRARLRQKMAQDGIKERILAAFGAAYDRALADSSVVLSRPERERLYHQLLADILTELLNENEQSHGQ